MLEEAIGEGAEESGMVLVSELAVGDLVREEGMTAPVRRVWRNTDEKLVVSLENGIDIVAEEVERVNLPQLVEPVEEELQETPATQ